MHTLDFCCCPAPFWITIKHKKWSVLQIQYHTIAHTHTIIALWNFPWKKHTEFSYKNSLWIYLSISLWVILFVVVQFHLSYFSASLSLSFAITLCVHYNGRSWFLCMCILCLRISIWVCMNEMCACAYVELNFQLSFPWEKWAACTLYASGGSEPAYSIQIFQRHGCMSMCVRICKKQFVTLFACGAQCTQRRRQQCAILHRKCTWKLYDTFSICSALN